MAPFVSVLVGTSELFYDDHFRFSTPIAAMYAEALRGHHLPLWNPWILTGTPLVAERGSMLAHPGMLLALVMQPSHAVGTLMVLMLGVLAAGSAALLRELGVRLVLATLGGAAIGLSGPALSYTSNAPFLATLAFLPLVLLFALRLAAGRRATLAGGLALGMALLGGDLPGALLTAVLALLVFQAAGGRLRVAWPRLLAVGGIALVVGAGSWYPVVWALPLSERGAGIAASEAGRWSFHPAEALGFFWPHPLGLPLPRLTFWSFRWLGHDRLFLHSIWIGGMVAGAALLALGRRTERIPRRFVLAALVLLVVATGQWTGLWMVLRPIFTFLRYPSKLAAPAALLLALAGTVMLDRLLDRPRALRTLCLCVAGMGVLGATVGTFILAALARRAGASPDLVETATSAFRNGTLRVAMLAGAGAATFFLVGRGRLSSPRATVVFSVLILLDVAAGTGDLLWTRPTVSVPRPVYLPATDARGPRVMRLAEIARVRLGLDQDSFVAEQLRLAALMTPMVNALYHASVLEPYGLYVGEMAADMARLSGTDPLTLAELCAVDAVLAAPGSRASWLAHAVQGHRLVPLGTSPAGAIVLRSTSAFPRSFLVRGASLAPHEEVATKLSANAGRVLLSRERGLRGGHFVALDSRLVPQPLLSGPSSPPVAVTPVAWRPGAASYQITTSATALLVEMDAFMPGWRAYVDGQEQTILQANDFGRAVVVPPGEHRVEWRFFPRLAVASLFASWAGLLLLLAALAFQRRFRRLTGGET